MLQQIKQNILNSSHSLGAWCMCIIYLFYFGLRMFILSDVWCLRLLSKCHNNTTTPCIQHTWHIVYHKVRIVNWNHGNMILQCKFNCYSRLSMKSHVIVFASTWWELTSVTKLRSRIYAILFWNLTL